MKRKHIQSWAAISALTGFLCVGTPALAQSTPDQNSRPENGNEIYHHSVAEFDQFLDSHRETADQLRKEPDLVLNDEFLKSHPELQNYLSQHPTVRDQMRKDPNEFMTAEAAFEQHGDNDANGVTVIVTATATAATSPVLIASSTVIAKLRSSFANSRTWC